MYVWHMQYNIYNNSNTNNNNKNINMHIYIYVIYTYMSYIHTYIYTYVISVKNIYIYKPITWYSVDTHTHPWSPRHPKKHQAPAFAGCNPPRWLCPHWGCSSRRCPANLGRAGLGAPGPGGKLVKKMWGKGPWLCWIIDGLWMVYGCSKQIWNYPHVVSRYVW
jgi:hypothetical protein